MKLRYILLFLFLSTSFFYIDNVNAQTIFDSLEDKYYIIHKWVGNSSSTGNNAYYIGIYNNYPTVEDEKISDLNEPIVYHKFSTKYNLIQFINTGDTSYAEMTVSTIHHMQLNTDSSYMYYSNFDIYVDNSLYFAKREYGTYPIPDDLENYYNVTTFYDNESSSYIEQDYYILKSKLDSMMYDDVEEWADTSSDASSSSLDTIKNNILNGSYDSYMKEYGSYYVTYNANTYNANKICFFKNYDDIYLKRSYYSTDDNYQFAIYLKDAYCLSYTQGGISSEYELNDELTSFTYIYSDMFNNVLSLNTSYYTIYYSDEDVMSGLLGNEVTITPTITISKDSEEITTFEGVDYITAVNMKIETSVTDDTSYICMISTDLEEWDKYSCSESYTYRMESNGTLYVKIVDKNTEDMVISATYQVTTIEDLPLSDSEERVNIYFQKITEDVDSTLYNQCTISQGGISYRACETLSISFDVINYDKYIYQMSLDNMSTWEDVSTKIYNNFYLERVFEDKVIYIRVLNREDNSLNNSATYQVTTIEDTSSLGQKVLFSSTYKNDNPSVDVMALFINYDSTNYNYYYSLYSTEDSFTDITSSIDCTNNLCIYSTRIYVKGTMYIRIEDKSGNLVYTATYSVDYYNWIKNNNQYGVDDFYTTFRNAIDFFVEPISEIFNKVSIFFDSLPSAIQYAFYVAFILLIMLFIVRFIL